MAKKTPWLEIKKLYLAGVKPNELAKLFHLTAAQISNKANKDKWKIEKAEISEKVREKAAKEIEEVASIALNRLRGLLQKKEITDQNLIAAIGKAFDISGWKTIKQDLSGAESSNTVFVFQDEIEEMNKHIKDVING